MVYEALAVKDCKSTGEIRATYSAARQRILAAGRWLPPGMLGPPCHNEPRHMAAILTLEAVEAPKISAQEIIAAVARAHGVTVGDMKGPRRWITFVNARHHAVALIVRMRPDLSLPLIGKILNRDHTTIINARRRWPRISHEFERQQSTVSELLGFPEAVDSFSQLKTNRPMTPCADKIAACG